MIYETTLNKIRSRKPCKHGWWKLLISLRKTKSDDDRLSLGHVLESNGLRDAIWSLRACDDIEKDARLFAVECARRVTHMMNDQRSIDALDIAEKYANGGATRKQLSTAKRAALSAYSSSVDDDAHAAAHAAFNAAFDGGVDCDAVVYSATTAAITSAAATAAAYASTAAYATTAAECAAAYAAAAAADRAVLKYQKQLFIKYFCTKEAAE